MVSHTALSRILADIPRIEDWIGFVCEEMWPSSVHSVEAMIKLPGSEDIGHTGFIFQNGSDLPFFDAIANERAWASRFANCMTLIRSTPLLSLSFFIDSLKWTAESCPRTIVDVGVSRGAVGIEMLRQFPYIKDYVVPDLPDVIRGAETPLELTFRLRFKEYNFFTEQNVKGSDLYLFRHVIYDWSNEWAI